MNYKTKQFENILENYDAVFDTLGGESLEKSFTVLKDGGEIVSISGLPNARFAKDRGLGFLKTMLLSLVSKKLTKLEKKHDVHYRYLFMKASGEQLRILTDLIESGKIKPVIDKVFSFEEAQKAIEYSESGRAKGKVILKIK